MIEALTATDLRAAYTQLATPLKVPLTLDESKIEFVVRSHVRLLSTIASQDDHVIVRELSTQLIVVCSGLDMLLSDLDRRFGLLTAERWLERNGYLMMPIEYEKVQLLKALTSVPRLPEDPGDEHLDAVRTWVIRNIIEIATGTTLAERVSITPPGNPPLCFVACPLTGLVEEAKAATARLCDHTASVLSEYGISSLQPALYTDPGVTPVDVDDPVYRSIDEHLIAHSDLVLIVAARRSFGLGVVASMSQRYRKPLLFATPDLVVSPMITGLEPAPRVLDLNSLEAQLRMLLDQERERLLLQIETSREVMRTVAARWDDIRERIADRELGTLAVLQSVTMSRTRFHELLGCPEMFAGATVPEVLELQGLAGR